MRFHVAITTALLNVLLVSMTASAQPAPPRYKLRIGQEIQVRGRLLKKTRFSVFRTLESSDYPDCMSILQTPESAADGRLEQLPRDIERIHIVMVNAYMVGDPDAGSRDWVLVDAGLPFSASRIISAAERRYGPGARPRSIVLTHGHFDHVGGLHALLQRWDVPVYAHDLELPFLTGRSDYPPADPTVGGGAMARTSFIYPRHSYDFRPNLRRLPADGSLPDLPGWRWIHTPGHAPGHISLFRDADRALIAGDAFTTQNQASFWGVVTEHPKVHGPPSYFTIDWEASRRSVRQLNALDPSIAATGHGIPMGGARLKSELDDLAQRFDQRAIPAHGRYVKAPVFSDQKGVLAVPPPVSDPALRIGAVVALAAIAGAAFMLIRRRNRSFPLL
jgi:glyoxylase-like metal-dependent hydrolase (beta-lactamase superfamily II)